MLLLFISVFPVLVIMLYLYQQDKYEKEPVRVLIKAFAGGILAAVSTILLFLVLNINADLFSFGHNFFDAILEAFLFAAIPEEILKCLFFFWFIWKNKNFNENYDGIIYAAFVSLGFACVENIFYVFEHGLGVGIMRAILSVPAHAIFGIIMGYYFSKMKFNNLHKDNYLLKGLGFAILAHGIYDFILFYVSNSMDEYPIISTIFIFLFLAFVIKLYQIAYRKIKKHVESSVFKKD